MGQHMRSGALMRKPDEIEVRHLVDIPNGVTFCGKPAPMASLSRWYKASKDCIECCRARQKMAGGSNGR